MTMFLKKRNKRTLTISRIVSQRLEDVHRLGFINVNLWLATVLPEYDAQTDYLAIRVANFDSKVAHIMAARNALILDEIDTLLNSGYVKNHLANK